MRAALVTLAAALALTLPASGQSTGGLAASELLSRVGHRVADYYSRARTILSREMVRLQPLDRQLRPVGEWRQLVYDVRVEWDPSRPGEPAITRELISAGGRLGNVSAEDADCFDLKALTAEPMAMLLPDRQKEYMFVATDASKGRRSAAIFDFRQTAAAPPTVAWRGNCATIDLKGNTLGRVWIDPENAAVLRIDERLARPFPFLTPNAIRGRGPMSQTVDRVEMSVTYEPVAFRHPDETLMLPAAVRTLAIIHNSSVPQLLTLQSYGDYRRFVTGGRVVK